MDSKQDVESQPLVPQPAAGAPAAMPKFALRQWKAPWWHLLGDCSGGDVAASALAWKFPCLAWSWNQQRALTMHFGKELFRFIALTVGLALAIHFACCLAMMTLCPEAQWPVSDDVSGPRSGLHDPNSDEHDGHREFPHECVARLAPAVVLIVAASIAALTCLALFLARRRTAIRERFGIEGSVREDRLLTAFCMPCALAQETRTLMHEQVHDGVWFGALPGVAAPSAVVAAPIGQKMVV